MKKFITLFSIALAFAFTAQAQLQLTAGTAKVDGVVDGDDPWGDTWISQNDSVKGTTTDMTSEFQVANDGEKIYFVGRVVDATPSNDGIGATYEQDCIETFFSFKSTEHEIGDYTDGDYQIRCLRANADDAFIDGSGTAGYATVAELLEGGSIEYGVVSDDDGYVIEMSLVIADLVGVSDFDGVNFRMDVATADNTTGADGGRTQQNFWNSMSDLQWNNTTYFGAAMLAGGSTNVTNNAAASISAYVSGSDVVVSNVSGLVSIYNVAGQLMTSEVVDGNGTINISNLNSGLYIVKNNDYSVKIMK